jgi:DNA mismatch repair ATPase MutS
LKFLNDEISESIGFKEIWQSIEPISELGIRAKKRFIPYLPKQEQELKAELEKLGILIKIIKNNDSKIHKIKNLLSDVKNIYGIINQSRSKKTILDDVDIFEVKKIIIQSNEIKEIIQKLKLNNFFKNTFKEFPELLSFLSLGQNNSESFYLSDQYDEDLALIRKKRQKLEKELIAEKNNLTSEIEKKCSRHFSLDNEISVSKNDQDIIEYLKKSEKVSLMSENFAVLTFKLIETERISELKSKIIEVKKEEEIKKKLVRKKITNEIQKCSLSLLENLDNIAYLDFMIARAEFSIEISAVKPKITSEKLIKVKNGRHLIIENELNKKGVEFTPIDLELKSGSTLITGPNMGGKTVSLKLTALLTVMAQHSLFVPADNFEFNLRNYIYFSLTSDDIKSGLSNFGTEISNLKNVVAAGNDKGLILIDEIAHGTNPAEGYAIAYGIIEKLDTMNSISAITTHYQRLANKLEITHFQVKGLDKDLLAKYHNHIREQGIDILNKCMDYRLERVKSKRDFPQDAIRIAGLLGFDQEILETAKNIMNNDSTGGIENNG